MVSISYHAAPTLIRYAGDDQPPRNRTRLSAASMFLMGYDTLQIEKHLEITEAQALKRISLERSKRLGLPSPYVKPSTAGPLPLVGSGGNPSKLSPSAGRAKMDEVTPHPDRSVAKTAIVKAQEGQAANSFPSSVPISQARTILAGEVENTSVSLAGLSMQVRP